MFKGDNFLVGIVIGIGALVLVTVVFVLMQSSPEYLEEDTPAGVAHNYLLALQFEDYERALGYIAPCVQGVPQYPEELRRLTENDYKFYDLRRDTSLLVDETFKKDNKTYVRVHQTEFNSGDPFDTQVDQSTFLLSVAMVNGNWRLYDGERYWSREWVAAGCP